MAKQLERRTSYEPEVRLEEREEEGKLPKIAGYAALFNTRTTIQTFFGSFTEAISPGAFKSAIARSDVRLLFNHDPNFVLGRTKNGTLRLSEDERGLFIEGDPPKTQQARDVVENIRVGNVTGQSFAFTVKKDQWTFTKSKDELDHREILEIDTLFDAGPVTYPAYSETSVGVRQSTGDIYKEARSAWEASLVDVKPPRGLHPSVLSRRHAVLRLRQRG